MDAEPDEPDITPGLVERAFRRLAWPASPLVVQPTGGTTLVNLPTNVFTENREPSTRRVTLLGRRVTIEATPTTYRWRFGDGTTLATSSAGRPYPDLEVTHDYRAAGRVTARVDTTYRGRYRVGRGPWVGIAGTHTVAGGPVTLRVVEARPKLTGQYRYDD